nr:reverse transcriptase domain-containing protein [Tanacetum cinerariifolium]
MSESSVGNYRGKKIVEEKEPNEEWVNLTSQDNIILGNYVKKCLSNGPILYKMRYPLPHKLDENKHPHTATCQCCKKGIKVQNDLKKFHDEMRVIHYFLNNNFKLLCSMVKPLARSQPNAVRSKQVGMAPKKTSTSVAPAMTQAVIWQLVIGSVATALETFDNKYYPRTEVRKIEDEFYNLVAKGNNLKTYARRFQELATLCPNMVPNNRKLMEVFIGGLTQSIERTVTASKPQTLEEATNIAQRLMDQIIKRGSMQGTSDHKQKFDDRINTTNKDNNNYPQ